MGPYLGWIGGYRGSHLDAIIDEALLSGRMVHSTEANWRVVVYKRNRTIHGFILVEVVGTECVQIVYDHQKTTRISLAFIITNKDIGIPRAQHAVKRQNDRDWRDVKYLVRGK